MHIHGPVQAWAAIDEACSDGAAKREDIARLAMEACTKRIHDLEREGVDANDQRIKKEKLTRAFIERLLLGMEI